MPYFRELMQLANPPGTEAENLPTRRTRGRRYFRIGQLVLAWFRIYWPVPRLGRWAAVTLHEDVQEVLSRHDVFQVPFGQEIARLNDGSAPGTPFVLGMDREACHDAQQGQVMAAFRRRDVRETVTPLAAAAAARIVAAGNGKLEAIRGLITAVPVEICRGYYGVPIAPAQERAFADAAIALSGHLFGLPPIKPGQDAEGTVVRDVIDDAIRNGGASGTVLARLLATPGLSPKEVRAILIGMIIGFVPTNTMAGGNILELLLRHEEFKDAARSAALQGDDDLLAHSLFEALRFNPINFGPFRTCSRDYVVAAGTPRAKRIPAGTHVLASTQSAMFDCNAVERAFEFIPGRPASSFMHFGFGMHWCVGAFIAQAQIVQTFKALLVKEDLRAEGRLRRGGSFPLSLIGFPEQLDVRYQP